MQVHEADIQLDFEQSDLYKRILNDRMPGEPRFIAPFEEKTERYSSWEDLASSYPWLIYLNDPDTAFDLLLKQNRAVPLYRYKLIFQNERGKTIEKVKKELEKTEKIEAIGNGFSYVDPKNTVISFISPQDQASVSEFDLGDLFSAARVSQEQILQLANSKPGGCEGAYQQLANIFNRPVIGYHAHVDMEYLPQL